jgi:hypothetical protein
MSFVGKKSSQNEIKMKERPDENLKILINDKIFEIMTRNNSTKEKVKYNLKNSEILIFKIFITSKKIMKK